jgi:protein-S-isoprenylcysteine O-methyltransferase Ste14
VLITHREDEMLAAKFGEKYLRYKKRVGGFLPKMSRSKSH